MAGLRLQTTQDHSIQTGISDFEYTEIFSLKANTENEDFTEFELDDDDDDFHSQAYFAPSYGVGKSQTRSFYSANTCSSALRSKLFLLYCALKYHC
jgi:hypothetical protein